MDKPRLTLMGIVLKTILTHTVTYFLIGWLAYTFFSHVSLPGGGGPYPVIRPVSEPIVMAGTALQVMRGILFGVVFYLLRESLFARKNGGLILWLTLVVFGILGTFGPASGSLEGMIFTYQPLLGHLYSLPEILLQSLLLSLILVYWVNHPQKKWFSWIMVIAYTIIIVISMLGLIMNIAQIQS
jgi:hypothetical protein